MPIALATDRECAVAASPAAYTPATFVRPSASVTIVPAAVSSQPSAAASPFGWSRRVFTNSASRRSAGPCANSICVEAAVAPGKPGDRLGPDAHARFGQHRAAGVRRAVGAQHDVVAPTREHERRAHGARAAAVERQRPVAHLPAVAERAVEHRPPPERLDPGQRRRVVAQPVGQHDRVGAHGRPVRRRDDEPVADPLGVLDGAMAELDVRMLLRAGAARFAQVRRLHPIMPEQPADTLGDGVRRPVVVHHEHALARPAQHERRAQARGPAADDHGVVRRAAPGIEMMERSVMAT